MQAARNAEDKLSAVLFKAVLKLLQGDGRFIIDGICLGEAGCFLRG